MGMMYAHRSNVFAVPCMRSSYFFFQGIGEFGPYGAASFALWEEANEVELETLNEQCLEMVWHSLGPLQLYLFQFQ